MHVFKVSGATICNVVMKQRFALPLAPKNLYPGDTVVLVKRKLDRVPGEKQIQYVMTVERVRKASRKEINSHFPGGADRWTHLVDFSDIRAVVPFNLEDAIGDGAQDYRPVVNFKHVPPNHEYRIGLFIR